MTALIISGSIVLFFAVLLFSPVRLYFAYRDNKIIASVRYLFLKINILGEKLEEDPEKKAKRKTRKEAKKEKTKEDSEDAKKKTNSIETLKTVWEIVKTCKRIHTLRRHLIFYKISVTIIVGGDEAMKIATGYATIRALVENGLSLLDTLFVVKKPKVKIGPDFMLGKTAADISFRMKMAPFYVLAAGLQILIKIVKRILKNKMKQKKGGKQNEPTAASSQ